jgi:hypothetical protein
MACVRPLRAVLYELTAVTECEVGFAQSVSVTTLRGRHRVRAKMVTVATRPRGKGVLRPAICVAQGAGNAVSVSPRYFRQQVLPNSLSDSMSRAQYTLSSQPLHPKRNQLIATNKIAPHAANMPATPHFYLFFLHRPHPIRNRHLLTPRHSQSARSGVFGDR